jgi:hypothetical protein
MARQEVVLRVFVAFPDDLTDEVAAVEASVQELNAVLSRDLGRRLEMITWRSAAVPGVSTDPQAVINEQIGDNYDIFIGMLWTRFGTPTLRAISGTEEEFERAYAKHKEAPASIRLMIYFKRAPVELEQIVPSQIEAINAFRSKLGPKGVLYWDFNTREEFESYLRLHLSRQVSDWGKTWGTASSPTTSEALSAASAVRVPRSEAIEEGILDLIERGTEGFQIATEAMQRIGKLQEQMATRTAEKSAQLGALSNFPEGQRPKLAKQVINSAAVDLEQFAKGLSSEIMVLSEHFLSATEAFSKSFTYTECYGSQDVTAVVSLGEVLNQISDQMEGFRKSMIELRATIQGLPRFTTQFNRAKRDAVSAIDNVDRFAAGGIELLVELRRNFDALVSFFREQGITPANS